MPQQVHLSTRPGWQSDSNICVQHLRTGVSARDESSLMTHWEGVGGEGGDYLALTWGGSVPFTCWKYFIRINTTPNKVNITPVV